MPSSKSTSFSVSKSALTKLFDKFASASSNPDTLDVAATQKYFEAIGVDIEDISSFIVAEIVKCPSMGEITRAGFTTGWSDVGCDTLDKQKRAVQTRRSKLTSDLALRHTVYMFAFNLFLTETSQKSVEKDTAIELWKMLLSPPAFNWKTTNNDWLVMWLEFLSQSSAKGVNKDLWNQTMSFAVETLKDESLSWWDENSAWPALIDEFVEWVKKKRNDTRGVEDEEMEY